MATIHVTYPGRNGGRARLRCGGIPRVSLSVPEAEVLTRAAKIAAAGKATVVYVGGSSFGPDSGSWIWRAAKAAS